MKILNKPVECVNSVTEEYIKEDINNDYYIFSSGWDGMSLRDTIELVNDNTNHFVSLDDYINKGGIFGFDDFGKIIVKVNTPEEAIEAAKKVFDTECDIDETVIVYHNGNRVLYGDGEYPTNAEELISDLKSLKEDTVKTSDGKWTNKGKEGTHGKFKTKKAADEQRRAMFANGYKESLTEAKLRTNVIDSNYDDSHRPWPEVKKELINKYKKKGYTNVEVVRTKTDTKGLRNYYVCGDLKESFNKNITVEEDEEAFKEEFGEAERTKLNDEIMEDYEDVFEEAKVNRMVNEIIKDSFNEPIEESDEERIERKSKEYIGDRYEKVYETYCKCVGHEYGSVDESNLPLDENLLNYVSCVHNYDIENLKENIKQHMANTRKK